MSKNSIGANFTGSGSKRSKKYYSDKDAGKYFFKPDHSEYYPGSKNKELDYPNFTNEYDTNVSNAESDRPEIELHETNGATSVRAKTAKEIAAELNPRGVISRGQTEKQKKHKKKELVDVMLMDDDYEEENQFIKRRKIHSTVHPVELRAEPQKDPTSLRKLKNARARNTKKTSNYRYWQEEQRNGGENQIFLNNVSTNPDNQDLDEYMSPLEIALENHPNFIRDSNDDNEKIAA